jgi:hypothetical protein
MRGKIDAFYFKCPKCGEEWRCLLRDVEYSTVECFNKGCENIEYCLDLDVKIVVKGITVHPESKVKP